MRGRITVMCCCCKRQVQLGEILPEMPVELAGWVSIDRKPYCHECFVSFTEEDWEWLTRPPMPLGLAEIAQLIPGDTEPL